MTYQRTILSILTEHFPSNGFRDHLSQHSIVNEDVKQYTSSIFALIIVSSANGILKFNQKQLTVILWHIFIWLRRPFTTEQYNKP